MVRNEDILKDILLKMNYDPSKTLNENKSLLSEQSLPLYYYYYDKFGNLKTLPNLASNYPTGSTPANKVYPNITDGSKYPKQRMPGTPQLNLNVPAPQSLKTTPAPQLPKIDTFRPGSDRIYQPDATYVSPQNLMGGGTDLLKYTLDKKPGPPYTCQDVLDSNPARRRASIWHCLPYKSKRATELSKDESFCEKSSCQGYKGYEFLYGIYEKDLEDWEYFHKAPMDGHLVMDILAFGTFFIPVVGPFISLGLELTNAYSYYAEGENYDAGLALVFAAIPFGELVKRIPAVQKLGKEGLRRLAGKFGSANARYLDDELTALRELGENSDWVMRTASRNIVRDLVRATFKGVTKLSTIVKFVYKFGKKYPKLFSLTKLGLQLGGIWYSWDRLAGMYGITNSSESQTVTPDKVISNPGDDWEYSKEGDKYYTRKKGTEEWVLATGDAEYTIRTKVFDVVTVDDLQKEYEQNPDVVLDAVEEQFSGTDEERNKEVAEAFSNIMKEMEGEL